MKKIINNVNNILNEMLEGFCFENKDLVYRVNNSNVIASVSHDETVSLISGGGSGHEPSHAGFVGEGMLRAAVCGEIFTSPTPDQILTAIENVYNEKGVLLIVKNYAGDIMNFEMAMELAEDMDIKVEMVVVNDDIAVEDSTYTTGRRGVAGTVLVHKILGHFAALGTDIHELKKIGDHLVKNIKTLGFALEAATVPAIGKPGFILDDEEIEYGVGIHGEPGYKKEKMKGSHDLAKELIEKLKEEFAWSMGDKYGVLINGLGGTPIMEQYIFLNDVNKILQEDGIEIKFVKTGNLMTALDMKGLSLTLIKLDDIEWLEALNSKVVTPAWRTL